MPRDERAVRAQALLNQAVAKDVRQNTVADVSPAPADLDTVEMAFEGAVYHYASEWLKDHLDAANKSNPFAFVLCRSITQDEVQLEALKISNVERYHAFRSQKMLDIPGHIFIVTQNLEDALAVPVASAKNSEHILKTIQKLGVAERAIAVFEPPVKNLVLLRGGVSTSSRSQTVVPAGTQQPWKLDDLESEIAQFHNDQTRSPSAVLAPWSDAKAGVTSEKLEIRISQALAHQLALRWRRGSVLAEVGCASGRMDVFITREVLVPDNGPCVVEVKVLRDHSRRMVGKTPRKVNKKTNIEWAKKGLIQADLYRKDISAPTAYLCSFDARDNDSDLPEVEKLSKSLNVPHRRYFMYRSSGDLQSAKLSEAVKV